MLAAAQVWHVPLLRCICNSCPDKYLCLVSVEIAYGAVPADIARAYLQRFSAVGSLPAVQAANAWESRTAANRTRTVSTCMSGLVAKLIATDHGLALARVVGGIAPCIMPWYSSHLLAAGRSYLRLTDFGRTESALDGPKP